jgi:hypothetical protein
VRKLFVCTQRRANCRYGSFEGGQFLKLAPLKSTVALIGRKPKLVFIFLCRPPERQFKWQSLIYDLVTIRLIWRGHLMLSMTWPTVGAVEPAENSKSFSKLITCSRNLYRTNALETLFDSSCVTETIVGHLTKKK